MLAPPKLPIPIDAMPQALRRFADPKGPAAARMMAARGMVPVKGGDLVMLLVQLTADPDAGVSKSAGDTLRELPEGVLLPACNEALHPAVFHEVALRFSKNDDVLERLAQNHAVADATIAAISLHCPERITEIIAVNQQRLLGAPQIIEALYKNRHTRMSTADRLIELAARHKIELTGIPMFEELKKAIQGQLIPEASDKPLPSDELFSKALAEDADTDAIDVDAVEGTEEMKEVVIGQSVGLPRVEELSFDSQVAQFFGQGADLDQHPAAEHGDGREGTQENSHAHLTMAIIGSSGGIAAPPFRPRLTAQASVPLPQPATNG